MSNAKNDISFEDALKKLEDIVDRVQNEKNLDESLTLYKEGMEFYNICKDKLESAEQKINIISGDE